MEFHRRVLLRSFAASGLVYAAGYPKIWGHDRISTPNQTKGPFYPVPEISQQEFFDVDLTRKDKDSPIASGKVIAIAGVVMSEDEQLLKDSVVEVWQACETGRYNHSADKNDRPMDPNFQYWGRMTCDEQGAFRFKTILPGKYPGRTPHIHFRVIAKDRPKLVTQLYFADHEEQNRKDNIYMSLNVAQRDNVTTAFEMKPIDPGDEKSDKLPTGQFQIVLGHSKSTPPM
jgi:protocatechuate 3,4-dioxygenase, beta subunit